MRNRKERGIALITAIWVMAILLVLMAGFAAIVHTEIEVSRNFGQLTQARWAARAAVRRAEVELQQVAAQPYTALDTGRLLIDSVEEETNLGDVTYQVIIEDEAGKVNINTASAEMLSMLFPDDGVADCIIDWRDEDSEPKVDGAEDDYYMELPAPYHCKNSPFTTVNELLLVKGVTREMLDTEVTEDGLTLADILTVSSSDTNIDKDGNERVNIATANKETLTEAFTDDLTEEEIDAIITARGSSAFKSPADLLRVPDLSREKVAQIYDRLTTGTEKTRKGLVNINTAPAELLALLPGQDDATAQAIAQYRTNTGSFEDLGQLLNVEQVSDEAFMEAANALTTRSQVFKVLATAQYKDGVAHTTTCLLHSESDGQSTIMRVLYWHE